MSKCQIAWVGNIPQTVSILGKVTICSMIYLKILFGKSFLTGNLSLTLLNLSTITMYCLYNFKHYDCVSNIRINSATNLKILSKIVKCWKKTISCDLDVCLCGSFNVRKIFWPDKIWREEGRERRRGDLFYIFFLFLTAF